MNSYTRRIFFPGITPYLKNKVLSLPFSNNIKNILDHPAGPFTIHFWAPTFKWGITLANLADIHRPPDKISIEQQIAVTATGLIWSRFSMVIKPKNYNLFYVNIFMSMTGIYQLIRIYLYKSKIKAQ